MRLDELNELPREPARAQFLDCCHCLRWADDMLSARPFGSKMDLLRQAERFWRTADEKEKLEAFSGHARIGDLEALRNRFAVQASREQGQIARADDAVLLELKKKNEEYLARNGFIFIVCATGKSAEEMLAILDERLGNDRVMELDIAAREQGKITQLRLDQLIDEEDRTA